MTSSKALRCAVALVLPLLAAGCVTDSSAPEEVRPDVMPHGQPAADALRLDRSKVRPMYHEILAIDLKSVVQVASEKNVNILEARQRVEASRGRYQSAVTSVFPVVGPGIILDRLVGANRSDTGQLVGVNFTTLQPAVLVQFALNPGRVVYDVIASKKRLLAAEQQQSFVVMETIRSAGIQYYDLVFAQSRVSVARDALAETEELVRLTRLRLQAGTGLPVDDLRAQADLARRKQDLAIALNAFYQSSITLASTLYLDPSVTLVPKPARVAPTRLVREDLGIGDLLTIATKWRPDLEGIENSAVAAAADTNSTRWGGLSPQLQAGYQFGGLASRASGQNFPLQQQERTTASAGWILSPFHQHNAYTDRQTAAGSSIRSAASGAEEPNDWKRTHGRRSSGRGYVERGAAALCQCRDGLQSITGQFVGGSWLDRRYQLDARQTCSVGSEHYTGRVRC